MRSRRRAVLGVLAYCLFLLVFFALATELVVTLVFGEQPKFPRYVVGAPWGIRMNIPHAHYRHKSADVTAWMTVNGQGMRADHDYPYAKPAGTRRILSLGDSYTFGYEVTADSCFSRLLETLLRARGVPVEVLNAGVSGFGTAEELLYLEREGFRYQPDAVLVTFTGNDLVDNERTALFALRNGRLVQTAQTYIPGGGFADFLNSSPPLQLLSQRSNAFAFLKEKLTELAKGQVVREELANRTTAASDSARWDAMQMKQRRLAAALFERLYADTRARGIPLIVQSIPVEVPSPRRLVDVFPLVEFDVRRPGVWYVPMKPVLDPFEGKRLLYWTRSAGHWTPFSHALSARTLTALIERQHLLTR